MAELAVFDKDPNIYLFTSLTAGSSHIITATSRIETILRANKIPFIGLDTATHELGKKLFQRRASGKKLPLLVKEGYVLGGIEEIEEWNEYDELHEALGVDTAFTAYPPKPTSLFEPAPSKTPPPLAGALPGGFSFGQSGESAFASLGAFGGSKTKENQPMASAEQNLAIRQMGAEAAKIAASKKPAPVKISTTNPLMTEKTNAKSPADILSPKSTPLPKSPSTATTEKSGEEAKKIELLHVLSPRSIPLPQTPGGVPKLEQQKPVHAPPSMHDDAENPALSAGPIKETQAKEESSEEEEDSDEEESSEDSTEKKGEETPSQGPGDVSKVDAGVKKDEQDEESSEESSEEESEVEAKAEKKEVEAKAEKNEVEAKVERTQEQDPKDASKAGVSVKEGEQEEEESSEEESSEEESEAETKAGDADTKAEANPVVAKPATPAAQPKQSSSEETSEEEDDESEEEVETGETKKAEVKKTQTQDAKDASKAGESVLD